MGDIAVENYKKSVARIVEDWGKAADKAARELAPLDTEIDKLESNKSPSPDDSKRLGELKKKRDAVRKCLEAASISLRVNLMVIELPPQADERELVKLPGWLKEIIKQKGLPLGNGVSIAPEVSFDFKAKKLKSFGLILRW